MLVVAQKAVSKAEGRVVRLDDVEPSQRALELADDRDPRHVEWILRESAHVVRVRPPLIIAETRHGYVCASAGVDASNAKGEGTLSCSRSIPMPRPRGSGRRSASGRAATSA